MSNNLFYVEAQESLATDKFSKHGRTMELHLVAKNIAFVVHIAAAFDLNQAPPSAKLIYDFEKEGEERDVEVLKANPLEYVAHIEESGNKAAVEAKVGVLSSQHEGAYFRIKLWCQDPVSGATLCDFSQPIKVISKRTQVKKMMERKLAASKPAVVNPDNGPTSPITLPIVNPTKRPAATDGAVSETLVRMEEQQREQMKLLQMLVANNVSSQTNKRNHPEPNELDFEEIFTTFLKAYSAIPQDERPTKIRRVVKKLGEDNLDNLLDFVGTYSQSACSSALDGSCTEGNCKCKECPHKRELSRMEDLYQDFFAEPLSPQSN